MVDKSTHRIADNWGCRLPLKPYTLALCSWVEFRVQGVGLRTLACAADPNCKGNICNCKTMICGDTTCKLSQHNPPPIDLQSLVIIKALPKTMMTFQKENYHPLDWDLVRCQHCCLCCCWPAGPNCRDHNFVKCPRKT